MPVLFQTQVSQRCHRVRLLHVANRILAEMGEPSAELSVTFVGDRRMRTLNRQYRKQDRTTDVLAFAVREGPLVQSALLGDVVVSMPTAIRQAKTAKRSLDEELIILLIHGILHLFGYDHERNEQEAHRMRRKEQTVLHSLRPLPTLIHRTSHAVHLRLHE
jgi:probable rRNA maturation factor